MNKKITILSILIISIFLLSGCETNKLQEDYSFYMNKEENEKTIKELEKDIRKHNDEVKLIYETYEKNMRSASSLETEVMKYLNNNQINGYNINNNLISSAVSFDYSMIVLKTHLMAYAEDYTNMIIPKGSSVAYKKEAYEKYMAELIENAEIKYYVDFDKGQTEQVITFKLGDFNSKMFSMLWEYNYLTDTNFTEIQEFDI